MIKLFKCELLKYRTWTLSMFLIVFLVLLSMQYTNGGAGLRSELLRPYAIFGGIVLGLVQMVLHTRGSNWTYLIHRPLEMREIFTGLIGAGLLVIFICLAMPLLLTTALRDISILESVDIREYGYVMFLYLLSTCFYLISCLVVLNASKGTVLLYLSFGIILLSYTPSNVVTQFAPPIALVMILLYLNYTSFKSDLRIYDTRPSAIICMSVAMSFAITIALTLGLMAIYNAGGMMVRRTPFEQRIPEIYARLVQTEAPEERLAYALDMQNSSDSSYYVKQATFADHKRVEMYQRAFPFRGQITNPAKDSRFANKDTHIQWTFSHDSMLLEGYHESTRASAGQIGKRGFLVNGDRVLPEDKFDDVPIILGGTLLQTPYKIYLIDYEDQILQLKHQLPEGERYIDIPQQFKTDITLMTNRRVLILSAQEFLAEDTPLIEEYNIPYPVNYRYIDGVDMFRYVDGFVLSFHGKNFYGYDKPGVQTFHARLDGDIENLGAKTFTAYADPAWYRQKQELISPVLLYTLESLSHWIHPASMDNSSATELWHRFKSLSIYGHIFILQILSLIGGFLMCRFHNLGKKQTVTWLVLTGVIGIPALLSFFLLNPWRPERREFHSSIEEGGHDDNVSPPRKTARLVVSALVVACMFVPGYENAMADEFDDAILRSQSREVSPLISRDLFIRKPQISSVRMSPDGRSLAYKINPAATFSGVSRQRTTEIWLADLSSGEHRLLLTSKHAGGLYWSTDSQYVFVQSRQGISALARKGRSRPFFVINLDDEQEEYFLGVDAHSPHAVLVSLRAKNRKSHGLYRVDINGELSEIYRSKNKIENILFDEGGRLSYFKRVNDTSVEVISLIEGKENIVFKCPLSRLEDICQLLSHSKKTNTLYMQARFKERLNIPLYNQHDYWKGNAFTPGSK